MVPDAAADGGGAGLAAAAVAGAGRSAPACLALGGADGAGPPAGAIEATGAAVRGAVEVIGVGACGGGEAIETGLGGGSAGFDLAMDGVGGISAASPRPPGPLILGARAGASGAAFAATAAAAAATLFAAVGASGGGALTGLPAVAVVDDLDALWLVFGGMMPPVASLASALPEARAQKTMPKQSAAMRRVGPVRIRRESCRAAVEIRVIVFSRIGRLRGLRIGS